MPEAYDKEWLLRRFANRRFCLIRRQLFGLHSDNWSFTDQHDQMSPRYDDDPASGLAATTPNAPLFGYRIRFGRWRFSQLADRLSPRLVRAVAAPGHPPSPSAGSKFHWFELSDYAGAHMAVLHLPVRLFRGLPRFPILPPIRLDGRRFVLTTAGSLTWSDLYRLRSRLKHSLGLLQRSDCANHLEFVHLMQASHDAVPYAYVGANESLRPAGTFSRLEALTPETPRFLTTGSALSSGGSRGTPLPG